MEKLQFVTVYTTVTVSEENGLAITQQYVHLGDEVAESELLQDVAAQVNGLAKDEEEHVLKEAWSKSGFTLDGLSDSVLYQLKRRTVDP